MAAITLSHHHGHKEDEDNRSLATTTTPFWHLPSSSSLSSFQHRYNRSVSPHQPFEYNHLESNYRMASSSAGGGGAGSSAFWHTPLSTSSLPSSQWHTTHFGTPTPAPTPTMVPPTTSLWPTFGNKANNSNNINGASVPVAPLSSFSSSSSSMLPSQLHQQQQQQQASESSHQPSSLLDYLTALPNGSNTGAWSSPWPSSTTTSGTWSSPSTSSWWGGSSSSTSTTGGAIVGHTNGRRSEGKRRRDYQINDIVTRTKRLCLESRTTADINDDNDDYDDGKRTHVSDATPEELEAERKEVVEKKRSAAASSALNINSNPNDKKSTALILYKAPSVDPLMFVHAATSMDELLSHGSSSSSRRLKSLLDMNTLSSTLSRLQQSRDAPRSILVGANNNNRMKKSSLSRFSNNGIMNTDDDTDEVNTADDRDPSPEDDDIDEVDISQLAATQRRHHNAYDDGIRVHGHTDAHTNDESLTCDNNNDMITATDSGHVMAMSCCGLQECAPTNALVVYDPSGMTRVFNDLGDDRRFACRLPGPHHHHAVPAPSKSSLLPSSNSNNSGSFLNDSSSLSSSSSSSSEEGGRGGWFNNGYNNNGLDNGFLRSIQKNDVHVPQPLASLPVLHTRSVPSVPVSSFLPDPSPIRSSFGGGAWSTPSSPTMNTSPTRSKRNHEGVTLGGSGSRVSDDSPFNAFSSPSLSSSFTTTTLPPIQTTSSNSWSSTSPFDTNSMDRAAWSASTSPWSSVNTFGASSS
jgi:hypothetical protein